MWNPVKLNKKLVGHEVKTAKSIVFFGNANISDEDIKRLYKNFEFCSLNQVHECSVVEAQPNKLVDADAHFTSITKRALFIRTADCIPVMIENGSTIFSIHAGWRSLVSGIIKSCALLYELNSTSKVFIGPHIHKKNFEIGSDVLPLFEHFLNGFSHVVNFEEFYSIYKGKYLVDLNRILRKQLAILGVSPKNIFDININTYANIDYNSYRRDQNNSGRQYSFIVRSS